jgi:hypothetical protein
MNSDKEILVEYYKKYTQKQELPVVDMFVNGSGQIVHSL